MHGFAFDCIALAVLALPGAVWLAGTLIGSRDTPGPAAVGEALEREHHIARHRRTVAQRQETAAVADLTAWREARAQATPRTQPFPKEQRHLMAVPEPASNIFEHAKHLARADEQLRRCSSSAGAGRFPCRLPEGHRSQHEHVTADGERLVWSYRLRRIEDVDADYAAARDGLNPSWPGWDGMGS